MENQNEIATGAERPRNDNGVKPCPVDRGKLQIGLECCRIDDDVKCEGCPYTNEKCARSVADALAYIGWLEEKVEALEAEKPKGAWLMVCEEGEGMRGRTDGGECEYRVFALAALHMVMDSYRRVMSGTEYAEALGEMKRALADGSKFWEGLEADAKCRE